jgi:hypothetical protein
MHAFIEAPNVASCARFLAARTRETSFFNVSTSARSRFFSARIPITQSASPASSWIHAYGSTSTLQSWHSKDR